MPPKNPKKKAPDMTTEELANRLFSKDLKKELKEVKCWQKKEPLRRIRILKLRLIS